MKEFLGYGIIFVLIYLCYVLFVILRKNKLEKFQNSTYVRYLEKVYHLDRNKISMQLLAHIISLSNAGIITITLYIMGITDNFLLKMLIAFLTLIPFQLSIYHMIGRICQRKQRRR